MPSDVRAILALEVPIIVQLGERSVRVADVCGWAPGSIIELPKRADEELSLRVNNKSVGTGFAVKVGENFGIRITYIGDLKARIAALGMGTSTTQSSHAASSNSELDDLAESMLAGQA